MPISLLDSPALTPSEAAEVLKVTRQTIYALIDRGELTRYKVGRSTRLNRQQVLALVGGEPDGNTAA